MSTLDEVKALVLEHGDQTDGTAYPFWYIAIHGGAILRRPAMVSHGIWFSRESAEKWFRENRHMYPQSAFVYCGSAHQSHTGLRKLYDLLKRPEEVTELKWTTERPTAPGYYWVKWDETFSFATDVVHIQYKWKDCQNTDELIACVPLCIEPQSLTRFQAFAGPIPEPKVTE